MAVEALHIVCVTLPPWFALRVPSMRRPIYHLCQWRPRRRGYFGNVHV